MGERQTSPRREKKMSAARFTPLCRRFMLSIDSVVYVESKSVFNAVEVFIIFRFNYYNNVHRRILLQKNQIIFKKL